MYLHIILCLGSGDGLATFVTVTVCVTLLVAVTVVRAYNIMHNENDSNFMILCIPIIISLVPRPLPAFQYEKREVCNIERLGVAWGRSYIPRERESTVDIIPLCLNITGI